MYCTFFPRRTGGGRRLGEKQVARARWRILCVEFVAPKMLRKIGYYVFYIREYSTEQDRIARSL